MSIKLKELLNNKSKPKLIAEGFFSKLKSLFGLGGDNLKKLKKDKKFMSHVDKINFHYDEIAKSFKKNYNIKINFNKFKASDFT